MDGPDGNFAGRDVDVLSVLSGHGDATGQDDYGFLAGQVGVMPGAA